MPQVRRFKVIQEREVNVSATSPTEAAILADRVFSGNKNQKDQLKINGPVRETEITVREDY